MNSMRNIKFRGKRVDTGEWVFGYYFKTPLSDENSGTKPEAGWFFLTGEERHCISQNGVAFVVDPNTVGQFTGLLDKNKKEIYEGDLINHCNGGTYTMTYERSSFAINTSDEGRVLFSTSWVVVGNIHD